MHILVINNDYLSIFNFIFYCVFHYITDLSQLKEGSFGVLEPTEDLPVADNPENALMVVPALSLDSFGYRLGYGGGYYDRFLPLCRKAAVILAAFEEQRAEEVPADSS